MQKSRLQALKDRKYHYSLAWDTHLMAQISKYGYRSITCVADSRGEGKQQKQLLVTVKSFIQ